MNLPARPAASSAATSSAAAAALRRRIATLGIALPLAGCSLSQGLFATLGPDYRPPAASPTRWHAPDPTAMIPHGLVAHGGSADALRNWWQQFDDPLLTELLAAAQAESANLAQAAARIEKARADAVAANAVGNPSLDATAGASRSAFSFGGPAVKRTQVQVGLQSNWEIDLFGGLARQREAARAQLDANVAAWHDARVALAAEVATAYLNFRFCEMQIALAQADAASRSETARLTAVAAGAGLQSTSFVALARASAADAAATLAQRRTECEIGVKGLVALTAKDEDALRSLLAGAPALSARLPRPARFSVGSVPANVLAQRPDVAAAERDVAVASADIGVKEADRFPRLALAGNINPGRSRLDGSPAISVITWSIGPTLNLPLLDGGRRTANLRAARMQYAAAETSYRARVRTAVREVEEALLRLNGVAGRLGDSRAAAQGYRENLDAARTRQRAGLGNLIELEDARRTALAADGAVAALEYEGVGAWIALYRAVGGGWDGNVDPARDRALP